MRTLFYKALWGMEGELEQQLERIASARYDGFESPVYPGRPKPGHGLGYVAMLFVDEPEQLQSGISDALEDGAELINVHAGRDWWSTETGSRFFESALRLSEGAPVCFETHRGRLLHEPKSAAEYLQRFPELRITADFSHWTCVCESMLSDQQDSLELAISRTGYIHARVGHEEGPQVSDPRAPEWQRHVEKFESWWDAIRDGFRSRGEEVLRVDPEFGPPSYMPTLPYTKEPVADLWEVCLYIKDRLRDRWS